MTSSRGVSPATGLAGATPVVVCGRGQVAVDILRHAVALCAAELVPAELFACPSGGDTGEDRWQPSLVAAARELGVPVVSLAELADRPDLVLISLEYDRIIDVDAFASQRLYNMHFSALPAYRGVYTSIWPILNGEPEAGVTLHEIDPGIDTGAIIAQRRFPLATGETARTLFDRFHNEATLLACEWYPALVAGPVASELQSEEGASLFRRSDLDVESARHIDLSMSGTEIDRRVRAFYFPEYQVAAFQGRPVRACQIAAPVAADAQPGTVLAETPRSAVAVTADGSLVELVWM